MKMVVITFFVFFFCLGISDVWSKQIKYTILKGKITKVEAQTITVKDHYGQFLNVSRDKLPKGFEPQLGKKVSWPHQVIIIPPARLKWPDISKLDRLQKGKLHSAIVTFLASVDLQTKKPARTYVEANPKEESIWLDRVIKLMIDEAYADRSRTCFYAGWSSIKNSAGECLAPWNSTARPTSGYTPCGSDTTYRCNPLLFGRGDHTPSSISSTAPTEAWVTSSAFVRDTRNPSAGICVESHDEDLSLQANRGRIVLKCLEATRHHIEEVISSLSSSEKQQAFRALRDEINHFCDNHYSTEAAGSGDVHASHICSQLTMRLERINFATQGPNKECRVLRNNPSTNRNCPRSVLMQCQQGGQYFLGYVGRYDQPRVSRGHSHPLSQWEVGYQLSDVENRRFTHLYSTPCASSRNSRVNRSERCLFDFRQDMNLPLNTFGNETCDGGTCIIRAQCLGINAGSDRPSTYDVMTACRCDLVQEAQMNPHLSSEVARSCLRERIEESAPSNFQEFLPDAGEAATNSSDR